MPPKAEGIIQQVATDLQKTCNQFVFSDPSDPVVQHDVRQTLGSQLQQCERSGVIKNFHIGNIEIDPVTQCIKTQIHIQPTVAPVAGIIDIGARDSATPETLAIQVPRDGNYTDRWEFIKEELDEQDEILASQEKYKQESRTDSGINKLKQYMSDNLSMAWKRLLR